MLADAGISQRMTTLRDQQIAWLKHIERTSAKTLTDIARASGISPSTFSKLLGNEEGHTLTAKTVARIEAATGVPAYESNVIPKIVAFSEEEARPYVFDARTENALEQVLRDFVAKSNSIDLWELKTNNLAALGLTRGMVVIVDREAVPRARDNVVAQRYDTRRGTAETLFRNFRPPYLITAPTLGEPSTPEIVDGEKVVIMGVIVAAFHIRH